MKKPIRLRALMLAIVAVALVLASIRAYRQYRADRIELHQLHVEHELAVEMKKLHEELAAMMTRHDESTRESARQMGELMEEFRQLPLPRETPGMGELTRSMEALSNLTNPSGGSSNPHRAAVEQWTRKESDARAAIARWRKAHWWFRSRGDGSP